MNNKRSSKISLTDLLPFILLLLGAFLRLICLGSVPGGMHQDESFVAWNAFAILHEGVDSAGHLFPVYMADWGDGHSALYVWLLIPVLALNGGSSRLAPYKTSPSTEPDVRLFRIRLFAKLIVQQLSSVDTYIYLWAG